MKDGITTAYLLLMYVVTGCDVAFEEESSSTCCGFPCNTSSTAATDHTGFLSPRLLNVEEPVLALTVLVPGMERVMMRCRMELWLAMTCPDEICKHQLSGLLILSIGVYD